MIIFFFLTGTKFTSHFRQAQEVHSAAYEWFAAKFSTNHKASR